MKRKQERTESDLTTSASAQDCTGLIPTVATEESEQEAYEEIFPYLPPAPKEKKND